jgi:replicative DNA helicase
VIAPPQNLKAEEAVLGAMIQTPSYIPRVAARLKADDFYLDTQRRIFAAIVEMHAAGQGVDPVTLTAKMAGKSDSDYIYTLVATTPIASDVSAYAELVAEVSARREWLALGRQIIESGGEFSAVESRMAEIKERTRPPGLTVSLREALSELRAQCEPGVELPPGLAYPWGSIQHLTGGLRPGWLCYLAGDTSAGKTAAAIEFAEFNAKAGQRVLFNSLEMTKNELAIRSSQRSGFNTKRHYRQDTNDDDRLAIDIAYESDFSGSIEICHVFEMPRLISTVDLVKPDLLIVDYLQLLDIGDAKSREEGTRRNSNALKRLAGSRQVAVMALAQFNRQAVGKEPTKHDLKDSGATEQDADQVILLYRPEVDGRMQDEGRFILDKCRMGETGIAKFTFDGVTQTFRCEERRYSQEQDRKRQASGERMPV